MPLLFWYLPLIILTGAYESAKDSRDDKNASADLGRKRPSVKTTLTIDQI